MSTPNTIALIVRKGCMIHMARRFPSTALSRFSEAAPDLVEMLSSVLLDPVKRAEAEGAVDEAREAQSVRMGANQAGYKLGVASVSDMQALHEFCAELTVRVEGFKDANGAPLEWSGLEKEKKAEFFDHDVQSLTKVNMYLFAYMIKNGVDPVGSRGEEPADG